jgi:excisionase family DNA binding protein
MSRTTKPTPREYLSIKHAAERHDCSIYTIREKVDSGELPAYRLSDKPGSSIRVKVSDLDAMMTPVIPAEIQAAR